MGRAQFSEPFLKMSNDGQFLMEAEMEFQICGVTTEKVRFGTV